MNRNNLLLFVLVSFFFTLNLVAQPYMEWQKTLGGSAEDIARVIEQTSDGGFIVAGQTRSEDGDISVVHGWTDFWVVKLTNAGTIEWEKSFGGTHHEYAADIFQTTDGGYIAIGTTASEDGQVTGLHGLDDIWVVKMDSLGEMQWEKTYGGSDNEFGYSIEQTTDGGYIFGGASRSTNGDVTGNHDKYDFWLVKIDSEGEIEWNKSLGGSKDDFLYALQQTTDGGYIMAGKTLSNDGDVSGHHGGGNFLHDMWVVKVTGTGDIEWQKCLGSNDHEIAHSVQQTMDGGYILSGFSRVANGDVTETFGDWDFWIVKLESDGELEWQKSHGSYNADIAHDIRQTSDGGYITVGCTEYMPGSNSGKDYLAMKLTPTGEMDWFLPLGGSGTDRAFSIRQTADEGFVMTGRTTSSNGDVTNHNGDKDFWVVKLGPCGVNPGLEIDDIYTIQSHDIALSTTHQWIDCSDGSIIEGVEGSSFIPENGGDYAVIVSNGACIDTSECINICPLDNYVAAGSDIIVAGEDSPGVTYQWIDCSDGSFIEGEVDYFFEPMINGEYAVIITEENCSVTSACRVVCPEVINLDIVVEEESFQSQEDPLQASFQWIDCNTGDPIEGATGNSFTPTISGDYAVIISRGVCSETSDCVTICKIDPAVMASESAIEALADPSISTYQWINCTDGSFIAGETGQSFSPSITGDYAVIITQGSCVDTSACTSICQVSTEVSVSEFTIQSQADTINSSYQWLDCSVDMPIEGEIYQFFTPEESGEYAVIVTQGSCVDTSECATFCLVNTETIATVNSIQAQADSLNSTFQWIDCITGTALEGETNPTFNPAVTGDYAVIVTQGDCESTSDCVNMVIVGVDEPLKGSIKLFPNPVEDFIILEVDSELLGATFSIYDFNGAEVFFGRINTLKSTVALNSFANAVYMIKVKTPTGVISKRFIKSD